MNRERAPSHGRTNPAVAGPTVFTPFAERKPREPK